MTFLLDRGVVVFLDRRYVPVCVCLCACVCVGTCSSQSVENLCFNSSGSLYGSVYGIFD